MGVTGCRRLRNGPYSCVEGGNHPAIRKTIRFACDDLFALLANQIPGEKFRLESTIMSRSPPPVGDPQSFLCPFQFTGQLVFSRDVPVCCSPYPGSRSSIGKRSPDNQKRLLIRGHPANRKCVVQRISGGTLGDQHILPRGQSHGKIGGGSHRHFVCPAQEGNRSGRFRR